MTRRIVQTPNAPSSANYSQAVITGGLVFVSGQGPLDPASGTAVIAGVDPSSPDPG